jgi:hypothetical protein
MIGKPRYRLGEIIEMEKRNSLSPGDIAGLIFIADGYRAEFLWVYIEGSEDGTYAGKVDDIPSFITPAVLMKGDAVRFTADNIIAIWKER